MEKEIQKRGIINTLRNMDVGDVEEFPIIQKTSVTFTLNQRLYKERSEGMSWTTKSYVQEGIIKVTRTA